MVETNTLAVLLCSTLRVILSLAYRCNWTKTPDACLGRLFALDASLLLATFAAELELAGFP